ncbi:MULTISPECIES: hypothetical protein [unclassified Chelatococcus]|uniref:hypothetical protein n=1 Tax=unclassified Chelatococcus TaxID=2638111 RepID=UPI001BCA83F4|nr:MULTISPECIES: hypothetical protein [unclassified Chelatococcus]CAH1665458.1 hypothetical protein CHELA41_22667 [Hyphomicrobiales bacterium]MBS7737723.1 hypothetical protein [Chelatococcus sp. HY11]MBX3544143.1 hypothetical protein [Chelatococcus sp.]MCO5079186.1 hypothetical protein [Chelatococcus sp.]CAH1681325.1 hypothetical protein CHELA20_52251 [Hyphomicrobiales bacterium]
MTNTDKESADFASESDGDFLERIGLDAAKWAHEFRTIAKRLGYSDMDEDWLIGWFANAIERGRDAGREAERAEASRCSDCPPVGYPTDETRCEPCDRRTEVVTDAHPDDLAVNRFAAAMKAKLAQKRTEGRSGWDDPAQCSGEYLSLLLVEHVDKGDPLDVGNLAMMLHQRGERIADERERYVAAIARRKRAGMGVSHPPKPEPSLDVEDSEPVDGEAYHGRLYGPHGHLIITPGLNEEHWRLEDMPTDDPDEISIGLFAKIDPFTIAPAALSKPEGK